MPETTRSNLPATTPSKASATQSDGAPSLISAGEPSVSCVSCTRKGRSRVLTCPPPDQLRSGASTVTWPNLRMACASASNPGACTPSSFVTSMCIVAPFLSIIIPPCAVLLPSSFFLFYLSPVYLLPYPLQSSFIFEWQLHPALCFNAARTRPNP